MNLQQLDYLRIIAETENFTKAANILSVTQPALSKSIANLEAELKVPLFEKSGRNIKLTRFGEIFLKYSNSALEQIETGIKELNEITNANSGSISISSTYSIGTYFMPYIISSFLAINPNTKFQFNHQNYQGICRDLKGGKIDLGFFEQLQPLNEEYNIQTIPIKKEQLVLITSKTHPLSNKDEISIKDLKDEYFISFCMENKEAILKCCKKNFGFIPKISIEPTEISMVEGLVAAGTGIAIVSNRPNINTNNVSIINLKEEIGESTIYMGWHKDSYISPITKKFKNFIIDSIE